jgi:hypothetical protein
MTLSGEIGAERAGRPQQAVADRGHGIERGVRQGTLGRSVKLAPTTLVYAADGVRYLTQPDQVEDAAAFFAAHPIPQSAPAPDPRAPTREPAFRERATPHGRVLRSPELG